MPKSSPQTCFSKLLIVLLLHQFVISPAHALNGYRFAVINAAPINKQHLIDKLLIQAQHWFPKNRMVVVTPANSESQSTAQDDTLLRLETELNTIMDNYSNFRSGERDTLLGIDSVLNRLNAHATPSELREKLISSSMFTKAWLQFRLNDKSASAKTLHKLILPSMGDRSEIQFLPPDFQEFVKQTSRSKNKSASHQVKFVSSPNGAKVILNHVTVGTTPLSINLPENETYAAVFVSADHAATEKKFDLSRKSMRIKATLKKNRSHETAATPWNKLKPAAQHAHAAMIASQHNATHVIFLDVTTIPGGEAPSIVVYNTDSRSFTSLSTLAVFTPNQTSTSEQTSQLRTALTSLTKTENKKSRHSETATAQQNFIPDTSESLATAHIKKSSGKKTPSLIAGAGILVAGAITAIVLATSGGSSSSSSPSSGGVSINLDEF